MSPSLVPQGKMMGRKTIFGIAATLALGACAAGPDMTNWSPQQIQAYYQAQAQMNAQISADLQATNSRLQAQNQALYQQNMQTVGVAPEVGPYGMTYNGMIWCRSIGSYVVTCHK